MNVLNRLAAVALFLAGSAQALTASADFTFSVTTPLPPQALGLASGGGTVTLGCTPCTNPANVQRFGFKEILFLYEQAPGDPHAARVGGTYSADTTTSWPYTTTRLPFGVRLFPKLREAYCVCGNGLEQSDFIDVVKPVFTIPPFLAAPVTVWQGSTVWTYKPNAIPVGAVARWQPLCEGKPVGTEKLRIRMLGAGVDLTQDFASKDAAFQAGVTFTPTTAGTIDLTCSLEPYGAVSNTTTMTVVESGGGGGGGGSGSGGGAGGGAGGSGGGSDPEPESGCSTVPGPAVLFLAAGAALLRRRFASRPRA